MCVFYYVDEYVVIEVIGVELVGCVYGVEDVIVVVVVGN